MKLVWLHLAHNSKEVIINFDYVVSFEQSVMCSGTAIHMHDGEVLTVSESMIKGKRK